MFARKLALAIGFSLLLSPALAGEPHPDPIFEGARAVITADEDVVDAIWGYRDALFVGVHDNGARRDEDAARYCRRLAGAIYDAGGKPGELRVEVIEIVAAAEGELISMGTADCIHWRDEPWRAATLEALKADEPTILTLDWSQRLSLWVAVTNRGFPPTPLGTHVCGRAKGAGMPEGEWFVVTLWDRATIRSDQPEWLAKVDCEN